MKKYNVLDSIIEYFFIAVGTFFIAFSLMIFLLPNTIAPGGFTGLSILIFKFTGVQIFLINAVLNIPLFIISIILLGKRFGFKTIYGIIFLSFFLWFFENILILENFISDITLACIYGGTMMGIGIGTVFRNGGTTGGTDLLGAIFNKLLPGFSIAQFMMFFDICVLITVGIVNLKLEPSLYSAITLWIIVKVADAVVEGLDYSKAFYIITDYPDKISSEIMDKINRGVTEIYVKGKYSNTEKSMILCVVSRFQVSKLKKIVKVHDENAFIMISTVHEVLGDGFKRLEG